MKNNKSSQVLKAMLMSAALLGLFGVIGTAMVTLVNDLTQQQIQANIQQKLLHSLHTVIPHQVHDNDLLATTIKVPYDPLLGNKGQTTIYQAKTQQKPSALAFSVTAPDGYSGQIRILIGIFFNGEISAVRIVTHKETPGLGDKIEYRKTHWLDNFQAKSLLKPIIGQWKVKKDGGEFDQFTGATITPRAVVKATYKALLYYKKNKQKLFLTQEDYNGQ